MLSIVARRCQLTLSKKQSHYFLSCDRQPVGQDFVEVQDITLNVVSQTFELLSELSYSMDSFAASQMSVCLNKPIYFY